MIKMEPVVFEVTDEESYNRAIDLISEFWEAGSGTPEAAVRDQMALIVDAYETRTSTLPPPKAAEPG